MQHLAHSSEICTEQEQSILELSRLFGEEHLSALFKSIFLWYFCPHESVRVRILENAHTAHTTYLEHGTIPEFFGRIPLLHGKIRALEDAPVGGKHNPERTESDMKQALTRAHDATSSHSCAPYDRSSCPCFWNAVFTAYYGEGPSGPRDSRYNTLFAVGMPAYQKLFT